jgi:uncharacterized protein YbaP (TraB family)
MILSELKDYMVEKHIVSLQELLEHFDVDQETMEEMLNVWIKKGKVVKLENIPMGCGKCAQCHHFPSDEFYEWVVEHE